MNLARHAAVLWRFRIITATGLFLGISLAILASYKVSFDGGPSLQARGSATYKSDALLLVTQPGFPEGRVVLPDTTETVPGTTETVQNNKLQFADPNRFGGLADLYSQLAMSDRVRTMIPEKPKPLQIEALALPGASGGVILPIIKLSASADTQKGAELLTQHAIEALQGVLTEDQKKARIPDQSRVEVRTLNAPSAGYLLSGPPRTAAILVFILSLLGTIGLTHLLAALRGRDESEDRGIRGVVDPWSGNGGGNAQPAQHRPAPAPVPSGSSWSGSPAPAAWSPPPAPAPAEDEAEAPVKRRGLSGRRAR
jgi:hypothetical protein